MPAYEPNNADDPAQDAEEVEVLRFLTDEEVDALLKRDTETILALPDSAFEVDTPVGDTEYEPCGTCNGSGGDLERDSDGDGVWAMQVTRLIYCVDCIGATPPLCPICTCALPDDVTADEYVAGRGACVNGCDFDPYDASGDDPSDYGFYSDPGDGPYC